jgi:hypothetical protein
MRAGVVGLISLLLLAPSATCGADVDDSAPPIVDQILTRAAALELSDAQVQALQVIRDRRTHTLQALAERLRAADAQSTAAAEDDTLTLMREMGRLQVMSGREALEQLSPAQRRRWVELQARTTH